MKIKTITCHEVYNHGASLQEHALLKFLINEGHEAKTLHYKPDYLSSHFKLDGLSNPKFDKPVIKQLYLLAKLPGRLKSLKRKKAFDDFAIKYIPTDHELYTSNEELKSNLPKADAYICGSDQIWNSFFQNGKDPAFYLDFVPDEKLKISYAASFAIDHIEDNLKDFVKEKVQRINCISVRETSGVTILNSLGINSAVQVLDPVFLLDSIYWKNTFVNEKPNNDFVFVYDFDSNPLIEQLSKKIAKEQNLKIITVNKNINYSDYNYYLEGPEKFLSLMYYAKYVITNSFHSVAFSLIFEKQFVVVNRTEAINTRMRDLLGLFNLSSLLINSVEQFDAVNEIDYLKLNERKEILKSFSKEFLLNALNNNILKH